MLAPKRMDPTRKEKVSAPTMKTTTAQSMETKIVSMQSMTSTKTMIRNRLVWHLDARLVSTSVPVSRKIRSAVHLGLAAAKTATAGLLLHPNGRRFPSDPVSPDPAWFRLQLPSSTIHAIHLIRSLRPKPRHVPLLHTRDRRALPCSISSAMSPVIRICNTSWASLAMHRSRML